MTYEKASHHIVTIDHFCDGDTLVGFIECRCCKSVSKKSIRLLKIESWELHSHERAKAIETARTLTNLYRGQSGILTTQNLRTDKHGRILADVIIADRSLALQLVEQKFAWWGVGEPEPGEMRLQTLQPSTHLPKGA